MLDLHPGLMISMMISLNWAGHVHTWQQNGTKPTSIQGYWIGGHLDAFFSRWQQEKWSVYPDVLFNLLTITPQAFFKKEPSSGLTWPPNARVGQNLKDLIERLLDPDPTNRLGYDGASNIANHPWLSSIDWEKMLGRHYLVRVMLF